MAIMLLNLPDLCIDSLSLLSSECGRAIVWNCASGAVEAALPLDTQGGGAMDADAAGGGGGDDGSGMLVGCAGP
jgi:hypothetical protein